MKDAKHWNWGTGACEKHKGQTLPCNVCVEAGDFFDDAPISSVREQEYADVLSQPKIDVDYSNVEQEFYDSALGEPYLVVDKEQLPGYTKNPCGEIYLNPPSAEMVRNQAIFDAITRVRGSMPSPQLVDEVRRVLDSTGAEGGRLIAQSPEPLTLNEALKLWESFSERYASYLTRVKYPMHRFGGDYYSSRQAPGESRQHAKDRLFGELYGGSFTAQIQGSNITKTFQIGNETVVVQPVDPTAPPEPWDGRVGSVNDALREDIAKEKYLQEGETIDDVVARMADAKDAYLSSAKDQWADDSAKSYFGHIKDETAIIRSRMPEDIVPNLSAHQLALIAEADKIHRWHTLLSAVNEGKTFNVKGSMTSRMPSAQNILKPDIIEGRVRGWMLQNPGKMMSQEIMTHLLGGTYMSVKDRVAVCTKVRVGLKSEGKREDLGGTHCPKCKAPWADCRCC